MLTKALPFFIMLLAFSLASGHKGENRHSIKKNKKMELNQDGFKKVSSDPSKLILNNINNSYLKHVKQIFSNKCLSCHGINNSPPWYYHVPGSKQLMDYDMREAKKHMDMSNDFPFGGHGSPIDDLNSLSEAIKKDSMPPFEYRIMHWDSKLTKEEIKTIEKWIKRSQTLLKNE